MSVPAISAGLGRLGLGGGVEKTPFPVSNKATAGDVAGTRTTISSMYFSDKIMITISQGGRLSQWVQVPLNSASPTNFDTALPGGEDDLLPLNHLTPKTLLGAGGEKRETMGHLYASQIASMIATKNAEEMRTVLIGFGLEKVELEREAFFDLLELVQKVL